MLGDLSGRIALVTGGGKGLGEGICRVLADCGARVAVADIDFEAAQSVAKEVADRQGEAHAFRVDVADNVSVVKLVENVKTRFGRIDVLVNSAGVVGAFGYEDTGISREEDWDLTYSVNVKGTVLVAEAVADHMKERRTGKIINISSHAGRRGSSGGGAYAYGASKAAVIHFTQSIASLLAPHNINVNCICPGTIWTSMWERIAIRLMRTDPEKADMTPRQIFDEVIRERCPLGREQTPEDIGKMAAFLASEDARNITGQAINVNGGTRMN